MSGGPGMHATRGDSCVSVTHGSPPELQSAAVCKELVGGGGRNDHIITRFQFAHFLPLLRFHLFRRRVLTSRCSPLFYSPGLVLRVCLCALFTQLWLIVRLCLCVFCASALFKLWLSSFSLHPFWISSRLQTDGVFFFFSSDWTLPSVCPLLFALNQLLSHFWYTNDDTFIAFWLFCPFSFF